MSPMKKMIDHLLSASAPRNDALAQTVHDATQFLECQIVLKSGYAVAGVLTMTPEGTLRLLAPAKKPDGGAVMADHYFSYDDVLTIVIGRELPSSLAQPARNGSPIILGH